MNNRDLREFSSLEEYGEDTFLREGSPETDCLSDFIGSQSPESATAAVKKGVSGGGEMNGMSDRRERKRNRTSEMHNLTERRRRGRIKEKLNALQELIPNAQKLDRASLLDEAISYVKSLQLQLQIISGASSTYQMPHLSPAALQYLQMSQLSPFLPMGMNFGVGVANMGSTLCPPLLTFPSALQSTNWVQMATPRLNPASSFHPSLPLQQVPSVPSVEISEATPAPNVSVQPSKQQQFYSMNNSNSGHQPIQGSVVDAQDFQCCSRQTRKDEIEQHGLVKPDNSELVTNLEKTNVRG